MMATMNNYYLSGRMFGQDDNISVRSIESSSSIVTDHRVSRLTCHNIEKELFVKNSFTLDEQDMQAIESFKDRDVLRDFTASLCPSLVGNDMIKAAIVLSLVGGNQSITHKLNELIINGNINILLIGDPAQGMHQLVRAIGEISSHSHVYGNVINITQLTCNLTRDETGFYLDKGALISDEGVCCIDEFDKMPSSNHRALFEVMEQQQLSLCKAGVVGHVPSRVSVLANANPIKGTYQKGLSLAENVKMNEEMFAKFDLVFVIYDRAQQNLDMKLTEQIINETSLTQSRNYSQSQANRSQRDVTCYSQVKREQVLEDKLAKRLAFDDQEEFTPISYQLMAKYIAYAKRCHFDGLDQEAEETIENFFLELLDKSNNNVSTAHLETLKKLTEAIAKLQMRESANKRDALDAIELVKFTMIDLFYDDVFDQLSSPSLNLPIGKKQGKKAKMKQLIQALSDACRQNKDKCFKLSEIKDLCKRKCIEEESGVLELVGCLNQSGILLLKGSDLYKFVN